MLRSFRLARYVHSELLTPTLLGIAFFASLLLMNNFFFVAREAIAKDWSFAMALQLLVLFVPSTLVLGIPMGTLLGSLIGVGRLSSDHEIVAIQAAGAGRRFLLRPVLIHGLLMTLASIAVYWFVQPLATFALRDLRRQASNLSSLVADLRPRVFLDQVPGWVVYAAEILPGQEERLLGAIVYQRDPGKRDEQLFLAKEARIEADPSTGGLRVDMRHGVSHYFREAEPESYHFARWDRQVLPIEAPNYLKPSDEPLAKSPQNMSLRELRDEKRVIDAEKDPVNKKYRLRAFQIETHLRFALPAVCMLFAILSLPLGMTRARSGKGAGFALSLLVFAGYYLVFNSLKKQASEGHLPVAAALWAANGLLAVWTIVAYVRMFRARYDDAPRLVRLAALIRRSVVEAWRRRFGASAASRASSVGEGFGSWRWISILDRHIATLFLKMLGLSLASTLMIFALFELKDLLDGLVKGRQPWTMLLRYYKYFAAGAMEAVLPIACLVAAVITMTALGRSGELTAIKAAGVSVRRACAPVLAILVVICAGFFLIQDRITPISVRKAQETKDLILGRTPRSYGYSPSGRWTFGTEGRLYHYRLYEPGKQRFQGLSVFTVDLSVPALRAQRFASIAEWNGTGWVLKKSWYRTIDESGGAGEYRVQDESEILALDPPDNFTRRETTLAAGSDLPDQLSLSDLGEQISALQNSGYDTTRLRVAYFEKIAHPVTPLVMVLLGLPFAFRVGRHGSLYGVGVALILVIVYWAAFAISNALGLQTVLPPVFAAAAPNAVFGALGAYLLLYVKT